MKFLLSALLTTFFITSFAQQRKPAGFANTYTLNTADGFPGNNYVSHAQFSGAGKIYIKDFFGYLHITGNNFFKTIPGVKDVSNNTQLYLHSENELWVIAEKGNISIIKNDSLCKQILADHNNSLLLNTDGHSPPYMIKPLGNNIEIYKFINDIWKLVNKAAWDSTNKIDYNDFVFFKNNQTYLRTIESKKKEGLYLFDSIDNRFKYINSIPKQNATFHQIFFNNNWQPNISMQQSFVDFYNTRKYKYFNPDQLANFYSPFFFVLEENSFTFNYQNGLYELTHYDSTHILTGSSFIFETANRVTHFQENPNHPSYLVLTSNKPLRVFPYIKKYPYLFNKKNSTNINAIIQDNSGRVWAGSYETNLSIINPGSFQTGIGSIAKELAKQPYAFMNAALNFHNKLYFVGESSTGGILKYDSAGHMYKLNPQTPTGYYLYIAPRSKTIWMPSAEAGNYPVYYCNAEEFEKPFIHWQKLDTSVGIKPFGFSVVTEDSLQRIWLGHPKKGYAVYNTKTKKAITYDINKNETPIGFISCVTDNNGTVFFGSDNNGLWFYNDYTKPPTPQNIHKIDHPLLNNCPRITSMKIYNNWLIMGCYNKICFLNLDSFYIGHKVMVGYLSPQETSFTSSTEQNTMLVSKTDSTVWFSTGDMLYQWDINKWLLIPKYKVSVNAFIQNDSNRIQLSTTKPVHLKANESSFDLAFEYLSPDCLPRYTRTALVKQGDSIVFSEPGLESRLSFRNLANDTYKFYVEIFEQDGNTSKYVYEFTINKFLWQQWWFWIFVSLLFTTPVILWLNGLRKEALQQKLISQLNIVTLSSQFRPHFILNALNTIGADLINKPAAETVISRLGESINLIFNQSQQKHITHVLKNEWVLVENVIDIHRIMYIPELQVQQPASEWLEKNWNLHIPVGLIEIMVENALLHGLRNKKAPPYILIIEASDDASIIYFKITDNGIGRAKAIQISSYKKHGSGTKNLNNIIKILNKFNKDKIQIIYTDSIFKDDENSGTAVTIMIPKNYIYEY